VSQVDLHIHTTASDGKFTPPEIVRKSVQAGLKYIGITDHDSIDGVIPACREAETLTGITVIGGVEINTDIPAGELHILGYLVDPDNRELVTTLEKLRISRIDRARRMVEKLQKLGVSIEYDRVKKLAGVGSVGRPHIAEAMLEKGYITSFKEAFIKYIGREGPAYVERDKITPEEAVQLVLRSRGTPVLAHPLTCENPEKIIIGLKSAGLKGLEIYYGNYSPEQIRELRKLAKKYDLLATGGSDFHGLDAAVEPSLGMVEVPLECAELLVQFHMEAYGRA